MSGKRKIGKVEIEMCFLLYAGTSKKMPLKEWRSEAPDVCVKSLTEYESAIKAHFTQPEVQYIGSASGCGCDFPNIMYQNGDWPDFNLDDDDHEKEARERKNCEALAALLHSTGEQMVELYGVWDGDFAEAPQAREEISVQALTQPDFKFKERGFYSVSLR
jgi:hypothetical protein